MPVGTRSISLGMVTVLADISCSSWFGSAANFAANASGLPKKLLLESFDIFEYLLTVSLPSVG